MSGLHETWQPQAVTCRQPITSFFNSLAGSRIKFLWPMALTETYSQAVDRFGESFTLLSHHLKWGHVTSDCTWWYDSPGVKSRIGQREFPKLSQTSMYFYIDEMNSKWKWPDHSTRQTVSHQAWLGISTTYPPGVFLPPSIVSHHPASPPTFITFCHCCATLPSQGFKAKSAVWDVRHSPTPWVASIGKSLKS